MANDNDGDTTSPHPAEKLRVLIIEDNEDVAESMQAVLQLYGYVVAVAYTGAQGLAVATDFHPGAVLCDIGLPGGMLGYEVARQLRGDAQHAGVYLVALTGYGLEEDQQRALAAGFDRHLTKPIDLNLLKNLLAELRP
jgi:CheY-like chemotaxis protein